MTTPPLYDHRQPRHARPLAERVENLHRLLDALRVPAEADPVTAASHLVAHGHPVDAAALVHATPRRTPTDHNEEAP